MGFASLRWIRDYFMILLYTFFSLYIMNSTPPRTHTAADTLAYVSRMGKRLRDQGNYIKLNLAIGGDWGGTPASNFSSATYEIDYVRVYQKNNTH